MDFFRVFDWDGWSLSSEWGGPFYVPRAPQGQGRHDIPDRDGVLYCSLVALSSVAECLQGFKTRKLSQALFERPNGYRLSVVHFRLDERISVLDLDNPHVLKDWEIKPSQIITRHRPITKDISARLFDKGICGFLWPSSLEGSWINATLFDNRTKGHLEILGEIQPLSLISPEVLEAANMFNIDL